MAQFFYIFYAVVYAGLLVYVVQIHGQTTRRLTSLLIFLSLFGLLWENGVIASGRFLGEGGLLRALNMGRYCLHFSLVPPLAWVLLEQLRLAGHAWAGSKLARGLTLVFILGLTGYGFGVGAAGLFRQLGPVTLDGVLRYTTPNLPSAVVAIAIMSLTLAAGLALWAKNRWPWVFLAALLAFAAEGALHSYELLHLIAGNGAEVFFGIALLQTELFVTKKTE